MNARVDLTGVSEVLAKLQQQVAEATGWEVTSALYLESQKDIAKCETECDQLRAALAKEREAHAATKATLASCQAALAEEKVDRERSETGETAALLRAATAEATAAQMKNEVGAARSKPGAMQHMPMAAPKKTAKQVVRSVVRERDQNGRASVVDTTVVI